MFTRENQESCDNRAKQKHLCMTMDSNASTQQIIDLLSGLTSRLDRVEGAMGRILVEVIALSQAPTHGAPQAMNEPKGRKGEITQDRANLRHQLNVNSMNAMSAILRDMMSNGQATDPSGAQDQGANNDFFLFKLSKLTLKRHATLTATLGGLSYEQIAQLMGCDVSTVKVHLRNALLILGIASRSILLSSHRDMLDFLDDAQYKATFGLGKRWWLDQDPAVIATLQVKRRFANQHSTPKTKTP